VDGSPNTPLPIMEFTTSAVRLQRPIARTRWLGLLGGVSGTAWFYHKFTLLGRQQGRVRRGFAQAWTAEGGRRHRSCHGYDNSLA
jgi:hypothetical protein